MSVRPTANAGSSDTTTEDLAKAMSVLGSESSVISANSDGEPVPAPSLNSEAPAISRNLVVSIRASLNDLVQESAAAKWQPTEGALNSIVSLPPHTSHQHCAHVPPLLFPAAVQAAQVYQPRYATPTRPAATPGTSKTPCSVPFWLALRQDCSACVARVLCLSPSLAHLEASLQSLRPA